MNDAFRTVSSIALSLVRRQIPRLAEVVVDYDGGRSKLIADLRTPVGLRLYRFGYSDPDVALAATLLRAGEVFVDGGAHLGLFSLVGATRVGPTGRVHAFEPNDSTALKLIRNIELNGWSWVTIHRQALGDRAGTREFTSFGGQSSGWSSFAPPLLVDGTKVTVDTVRLDRALGSDLPKVSLVKLDLEGAEYHALMGARRLLDDVGPNLILELGPDHLARQGASIEGVVRILRKFGYRIYQPWYRGSGQLHAAPIRDWGERAGGPNVLATKSPKSIESRGIVVE